MKKYKIYSIKLAVCKDTPEPHILINGKFGKTRDTAMLSYLISGSEILAVVDTGFLIDIYNKNYKDEFELIGDPVEEYKKFFKNHDFKFEDVTHIILTHMHWDHCENNHLFPNAKIYVQRKEVQTSAAPVYPLYYLREDVIRLLATEFNRVVMLDGDYEIADGLKVVLAGGHSLGSQMVYVNTSEGLAIMTGDILNVYENLDHPSVKEVDLSAWVYAVNKVKKDADIVLPNHDLKVIEKYSIIGK